MTAYLHNSSHSSITMDTTVWTEMSNITTVTMTPYNILQHYSYPELFDMRAPFSDIWRVSKICWYVLGMPMNLISFIVWIQPKMRHSSGCYLAALAINDFLFLLHSLLFMLGVQHHLVLCQMLTITLYTVQYPSTLLILAFTVEQYIAICYPMKRGQYCHSSIAMKMIAAIFLFSLALSAMQGYFFYFDSTSKECVIRNEVIDPSQLWTIWSHITESLVFLLTPFIILVLNILVIRSIRLQNRRMSMYVYQERRPQHRSTTMMLLVVSFYWIIMTLPISIMYSINNVFKVGNVSLSVHEVMQDSEWQKFINYHIIKQVINAICMSRFALNFCIYCCTGRMFRKQLTRVFCCHKITNACDSANSLNTFYEEHSLVDGRDSIVLRRNSSGHVVALPKRHGSNGRNGLSVPHEWTRRRANSDVTHFALLRNNNLNGISLKTKLKTKKDSSL